MRTLGVGLGLVGLMTVSIFEAPQSHAETAQDTNRRALQSACFPAAELAAVAGEEHIKKGNKNLSAPPARAPFDGAGPVSPQLRGSIRRVELPPGVKLVALTFDLCELSHEIAGYEGRIFETLRKENVKATLFAGGKWMRTHQKRTEQLMSDPLFELANHSEAHRNLRLLQGEALQDEILGPQRTYQDMRKSFGLNQCVAQVSESLQSIPPRLDLFRFPYGACNPQALNAVNDAGLLAIQWDVSTGDPAPGTTADAIVRTMVKRVKPGSIVIGHANGRGWHTAEALPRAIAALKKEGYSFVTVSELLAAGKPVITDTCYDNRPGDSDRYDHFTSLHAGQGKSPERATSNWGTTTVAPARKGPHNDAAPPAGANTPN